MWKRLLCLLCCFNETKTEEVIDEIPDGLIPKDLPLFVPPLKTGKVIKVYDGDTITIAAKPYHDYPVYRFSVRLNGIDAPELKTKNVNEKKHAVDSRDALKEKILGRIVTLENVKHDKYGRLLADVFLHKENICKWMLHENFAVEYDGGTKKKPAEWYE